MYLALLLDTVNKQMSIGTKKGLKGSNKTNFRACQVL